jgi:hypothetical protein
VIVSRALRRRADYADTVAPKGKGKCVENVLSTVVTSAVVATIVGAAINAWLEARRSRWNTRLDALRAAITLEGYAVTCADKIADHENAVSSAGHAGSLMGSVPDFPEVTVAAGFLRPRRASVPNRLLVFPQEVRQADQTASFWWEVVGDQDAAQNAATQYAASMGVLALELASDIRKVFDLPTRDLVFGEYNVREVLEKRQPVDGPPTDAKARDR